MHPHNTSIRLASWLLLGVALLFSSSAAVAGDDVSATDPLTNQGSITLSSPGPISFGPDDILFVGDPLAASIFALRIDEKPSVMTGGPTEYNVAEIDHKVAAIMATSPRRLTINDLAVHPRTGSAYLSVSRGNGPGAITALFRVRPDGETSLVSLTDVRYGRAEIPNAPAPPASSLERSNRALSITDLAYADGKVLVAGLSNEEFASTLRAVPFPFQEMGKGTSVEIYHGAHGAWETRAPVRTFAEYEIAGEPHLLAAYTCTPLVKFPTSELQPGAKVRGTTVAELGNRNAPLDMVVYEKDGSDWILISNNRRGLMKVTTENLAKIQGLTSRVERGATAGLSYETVTGLDGIEQLDRLDATRALVVRRRDGGLFLESVALP